MKKIASYCWSGNSIVVVAQILAYKQPYSNNRELS